VQAMMIATPSNRVQFARRDLTGGTSEGTDTGVDSIRLPYWVKLTRQANTFTASHSTDGVNWQTLGSAEIMMGSNVLIGLALTSQRDATRIPITAVFSNVTISGSATGQWQSQDIGLTYNATEPMYVVLQDSANKSAVVTHSDPAATLLATWTEWNIPLTPAEGGSDPVQGFALAGLNLRAIKKLSIGVGNRANPQRGGSGRLYIDDIQLRLPPLP